jgi:hypothetical protein
MMHSIRPNGIEDNLHQTVEGSIEDGFQSRDAALSALGLLVRIRKQHCINLDDLLVYAAIGLHNYQRDYPVRSVRSATFEELCELTQLPPSTLQRSLRSLMVRGLVIATGAGFMVRSTELWSASMRSLTTLASANVQPLEEFDRHILRDTLHRRLRVRRLAFAFGLPLMAGASVLLWFALTRAGLPIP